MRVLSVVALAALMGFAGDFPSQSPREYLYLWTASADSTQPDFLAVLDVSDSVRLVTTLPVPGRGNRPHHTEYEFPRDRQLFANGFASGRTFIFDLKNPAGPRLAGEFGDLAGYHHPHSYIRLPNGNLLATFQMQHDSAGPVPGGLVELTPAGRVIRSSSANAPGLDRGLRVYSAAVVPALDRIVTTTTDMDPGRIPAREIQIWRLSDLKLLHTVTLPNGPAGTEAQYTAEPRVLADGRTVLVSTFSCGLFLLDGLSGDAPPPSGRLVASFPRKEGTFCAVPVVVGHYYLVTVPAWSAVVSLDVSDPAAPREVGRVTLGADAVPHWIAVSPDQRRVVVTGYGSLQHRVVLLRFDPGTGGLSLDTRFHEPGASMPGYRMDDKTWPHGGSAKGIPHGAVFSRP
ncbi:MAG TPA: hypothetical protein VH439_04245 [Gemmatimonadales bacterium]